MISLFNISIPVIRWSLQLRNPIFRTFKTYSCTSNISPGAGYSKITYERALWAVKSNSGKCSVSETLIAIPKPHLRSS